MKLKCSYKSGYDSFVKFCKFAIFRSASVGLYVFTVSFASIALILYLLASGGDVFFYILFGLLCLTILTMAFFYFVFPKAKYESAHGKYDDPVENEFTFNDQDMDIETAIGESHSRTNMKYKNLNCAYEVKDYFYLYADGHGAYIVPKKNIIDGTPEQLTQALIENMGKKFIRKYKPRKTRKNNKEHSKNERIANKPEGN